MSGINFNGPLLLSHTNGALHSFPISLLILRALYLEPPQSLNLFVVERILSNFVDKRATSQPLHSVLFSNCPKCLLRFFLQYCSKIKIQISF